MARIGIIPPNCVIPDTWASLEEFARWHMTAGMPLLPPPQYEIVAIEDATAMPVFRKGQFQVEIYMVHPNPRFREHAHPGVDVVTAVPGEYLQLPAGLVFPKVHTELTNVVQSNKTHNQDILGDVSEYVPRGQCLIAYERWRDGVKPTTAAAHWRGKTVGPRHEALIRKHFPDAFIEDGYADVSVSKLLTP